MAFIYLVLCFGLHFCLDSCCRFWVLWRLRFAWVPSLRFLVGFRSRSCFFPSHTFVCPYFGMFVSVGFRSTVGEDVGSFLHFPLGIPACSAASSSVHLLSCSGWVAALLCWLFLPLASAWCGSLALPLSLVSGQLARFCRGGLSPHLSGRVDAKVGLRRGLAVVSWAVQWHF